MHVRMMMFLITTELFNQNTWELWVERRGKPRQVFILCLIINQLSHIKSRYMLEGNLKQPLKLKLYDFGIKKSKG